MTDTYDEPPWANRVKCVLNQLVIISLVSSGETPCHRCNQSRAKCGGLPRADGDPRP